MRFIGIVWVQGEQDAKSAEASSAYEARFRMFLRSLRADLAAPDVPVICGRLSLTHQKFPYAQAINSAFDACSDLNVTTVDTSHLTYHDGIHYDSRSMIDLGRMIGDQLVAVISDQDPA